MMTVSQQRPVAKVDRTERDLAAWKRWEESARKYRGLDLALASKMELRHISRTRCGYQIRLIREGSKVFDRSVRGHSEESLSEAIRLRDEALLRWPNSTRTNAIPDHVLQALGLTQPVVGIGRFPPRSVYRVWSYDPKGRPRLHNFYYRVVPEEVAYAAALRFLQSTRTLG